MIGVGRILVSRGRLWLVPVAVLVGLAIAFVDSRPGFDATGLTVGTLLGSSALFGMVAGSRPWLWALAIGAWTPLVEIPAGGQTASLVALVFAGIGSVGGVLVRRLAEADIQAERPGTTSRGSSTSRPRDLAHRSCRDPDTTAASSTNHPRSPNR